MRDMIYASLRPVGRRVGYPSPPKSETHLALDILTNADVAADLAMRNSVELPSRWTLWLSTQVVVWAHDGAVDAMETGGGGTRRADANGPM